MSAAYVCLRCSRRAAGRLFAAQGARNGGRDVAAGSQPSLRGTRSQSTDTTPAPTPRILDGGRDVPIPTKPRSRGGPDRPKRPPAPWLAHQIVGLITPERSPLETWHRLMATHAFSASMVPALSELGLRRSPEVRRAFQLFVQTALHHAEPEFPALETIVRTFLERGLFRYQMLADILKEARPALANAVFGDHATQEVEDARALELLGKIMAAWRLTLGTSAAKMLRVGQEDVSDWNGLPGPDELQRFRKDEDHYMAIFSGLFSGRLDQRREQCVAADSAWVYLCAEELLMRGRIPQQLQQEWKPWTDLMWKLLGRTKFQHRPRISNILALSSEQAPEAISSAAIDSWIHISESERTIAEPPVADQNKPDEPIEPTKAEIWKARIHRMAAEGGDGRQLTNSWLNFQQISLSWQSRDEVSVVVGEFLWAFARLQMRDMTVGVWRFLQESGLKTMATHWGAMLDAARRIGDQKSMPQIWATMLRTGFFPANPLWTTYITSLLRVRDWATALQAVHAMGEQWRSVARSPLPPAAVGAAADFRPSMIPINAAISGLIDMDRPDPVRALLKTAEEHGLAPSIETYNIFLRSAVRRKDTAGMRAVFADMKAAGCEPDVITFTLYIDGLVKDPASPFSTGSGKEAQAAIADLFTDMTSAGLQPTPRTYTTLLYNLLGSETPNLPAAQAVLAQMGAQGVERSSPAYTILARHYFQRQPPDLAALERLLACIDADAIPPDLRFYDTLVQGYARAGERDRMLAALRRFSHDQELRLWTLNDALALCLRHRDADTARDLVLQGVHKLRSPSLSKGERLEIRRYRDLVATLLREGVLDRIPQPLMFRKIEGSKGLTSS